MLSAQGLGQGFEWRREGSRGAREIVDDALEFLADEDPRPWFLWLHLYDVHRPYGSARADAARFGTPSRPGVGDDEQHYNLRPEDVRAHGLTSADLAWIVDRYDAGIAHADAELGPLFAALASPGRLARTLVIVTADHGESLLDHPERLFTHDPLLHSSVTRVPLLVRYPGGEEAGTSRGELVSLIDLAPTVLDAIGLDAPASFQGRSLRGVAGARDRVLHHECWGWSRLAAARTPRWLLVRDLEGGGDRLYSLASDPGERDPLDPATVPGARDLVRTLEAFARRPGAREPEPDLDAETRERLRRLGYVEDGR